jgi:hypothetical protein
VKAIQQHHLVALLRREHAGFSYVIDFLILGLSRHYDTLRQSGSVQEVQQIDRLWHDQKA